VEALEANPESHLASLIAHRSKAARAAIDDGAAARELRLLKQQGALLIALADIGGIWDFAEVSRALTAIAQAASDAASDFLLAGAAGAGQFQVASKDAPAKGSGFIVLGMGKLGAGELNYSSDVDLIVLFDPAAPVAAGVEPSTFFVRLTRDLARLLQERTPDGYVFRVDLRLRPDPGSTQAAVS